MKSSGRSFTDSGNCQRCEKTRSRQQTGDLLGGSVCSVLVQKQRAELQLRYEKKERERKARNHQLERSAEEGRNEARTKSGTATRNLPYITRQLPRPTIPSFHPPRPRLHPPRAAPVAVTHAMASKPNRTPAPDRPPPPVPPPPLETPPQPPSPSPPGEEFHTPTPSFGEASPREASPQEEEASDETAVTKSPTLSPLHFPSPHRLPPPGSPTTSNNGQEGRAAASRARPQLRLATGLVRTPSQGSVATNSPSQSLTPPSPLTPAPAPVAKSPSSSSSPSPLSPLTPADKSPPPQTAAPKPVAKSPSPSPPSPLTPAPPPTVNSGKSTPKHAEAWKPQPPPPPPPHIASPAIAAQFDADEEAATSPLRTGKPRLDQQRRTPAAAENGGTRAATGVPPDVAAVAKVGERRALSVALRLATAVLSLAAFSVMVSARTTGWAGDYYGRHQQYRYAVGVNVIVCAYSIAQSLGEIRRLISPRFIFRSMSSYYFSLFLDQVLAYLLMSASSAAASRNDLWVSRFGTDPFNKKINSAVWLSFIAFMTLAANALISTANLFSMV